MDEKEQFKFAYITAFLGSYAALKYDDNCMRGWPTHDQPLEDAECLAQEAWEQLLENGQRGAE
jgi:hypothetical protein